MRQQLMPICTLGLLTACGQAREQQPPWPTVEWPVSSPADQEMSEARLAAFASSLSDQHGNIDGMLVTRNGYVVYERSYERDYDALYEGKDQTPGPYNYYNPEWHPFYQDSELHTMQSVTKSVTSALIGIAIGRGELAGVDVPLLDFLQAYELGDVDEWQRSLMLRDLLTMRAGIAWDESSVPYTDPANSCARMEGSDDWIQFVAEQPMAHQPGTVFNYNSGASQLLSLIIRESTGKHVDEYAAEHLFGPLGITSYFWKKTPRGFPDTEGGLYLFPRDLAKVGYLYMMDGVWDDVRLLPEGWVQASVERSVTDTGWDGIGYGYQWWLIPWEHDPARYAYAALGYGGQRLLVVPQHGLVAVFTGWNIYGDTPALDVKLALSSVLAAVSSTEQG